MTALSSDSVRDNKQQSDQTLHCLSVCRHWHDCDTIHTSNNKTTESSEFFGLIVANSTSSVSAIGTITFQHQQTIVVLLSNRIFHLYKQLLLPCKVSSSCKQNTPRWAVKCLFQYQQNWIAIVIMWQHINSKKCNKHRCNSNVEDPTVVHLQTSTLSVRPHNTTYKTKEQRLRKMKIWLISITAIVDNLNNVLCNWSHSFCTLAQLAILLNGTCQSPSAYKTWIVFNYSEDIPVHCLKNTPNLKWYSSKL